MAEKSDVMPRSIVESAVYKAINKLTFSSLKPQQMMTISEFINRRCIVILPTGFAFHWFLMTCIPILSHQLYRL